LSAIQPSTLQAFNIGMGAVSSSISAYGQYEQGKDQQAAYDYKAQITLDKMKEDMQASEEEFSSLMGRQRSLYAKAGVDIGSGSPLLVMMDTARKEALAQQRIKRGGTQQAELQRYSGRIAGYTGTMDAMSTFMTGLGKSMNEYYQHKKG
jgi:hypothetical protein